MTNNDIRESIGLDPDFATAAIATGFRVVYELCCRRMRWDLLMAFGQHQELAIQAAEIVLQHWIRNAGTEPSDERLDALLDELGELLPAGVKEMKPGVGT